MSELTVLGLLIQVIALFLLFAKLGRTWYRYLGAIFIVMAVLYHGIGEILVALFGSANPYRPLFDPKYVGQFVLLVSVAILLFTIAYVWVVGRRPRSLTPIDTPEAALTKRVFDYRLMVLITAPLMILTVTGQGFGSNGGLQGGTGVGAALGLSQQFFILGTVLSGFGFVMRFGRSWIVRVLVVQSVILAFAGQRAVIVFGAVMLIYALSLFGMKIRQREMVFAMVLLILFVWTITAARGAEGRYATTSRAGVRLTFLTTGVRNLFSPSTGQQVHYTLGYRLDGNSYGTMSLQALDSGSSPVGLTPLKNDVLLAIPSFLNPNKNSTNPADRSDKLYVEEHLPIPELQTSAGHYRDFLPTQLGSLTGILGPTRLLFAALFLGLAFAVLDRWLHRNLGPVRVLIFLGVLYCVLDYEGSWDAYTTTLRGIVVLGVLVGGLLGIRRLTRGDTRQTVVPSGRSSRAHRSALQRPLETQGGSDPFTLTERYWG